MTVLMEARNLRRYYEVGGGLFRKPGIVRAVDGVSFHLAAGRTLAVVGESGSGKSTLARMATVMEPPSDGELLIDGAATMNASTAARRRLRLAVQMVFQNPYGSLNPRKTVGSILMEPLAINRRGDRREREAAARAMMDKVGLRQDQFGRYPHMFSGGQRQRIAIARVILKNAPILVLDEATSALDSEVESAIQGQLERLMRGRTVIAIAHRLSTIARMDRLVVLDHGRIVEQGSHAALLAHGGTYARLWHRQSGGFMAAAE